MKVIVNHITEKLHPVENTYIRLGVLKPSSIKTLEKHFPEYLITKTTNGYWQFKPLNNNHD